MFHNIAHITEPLRPMEKPKNQTLAAAAVSRKRRPQRDAIASPSAGDDSDDSDDNDDDDDWNDLADADASHDEALVAQIQAQMQAQQAAEHSQNHRVR